MHYIDVKYIWKSEPLMRLRNVSLIQVTDVISVYLPSSNVEDILVCVCFLTRQW